MIRLEVRRVLGGTHGTILELALAELAPALGLSCSDLRCLYHPNTPPRHPGPAHQVQGGGFPGWGYCLCASHPIPPIHLRDVY